MSPQGSSWSFHVAILLLTAQLSFGGAGCVPCGKQWKGPIPAGWYPIDSVESIADGDDPLAEALELTGTVYVSDDGTLTLAYVDPVLERQVRVEYTMDEE